MLWGAHRAVLYGKLINLSACRLVVSGGKNLV